CGFVGSTEVGLGCFESTPVAAEDIKFPVHIEAGIKEILFQRLAGSAGQQATGSVLAQALARVFSGGVYGREESRTGHASSSARFTNTSLGQTHVMIRPSGFCDQAIQFRIVKKPPPLREVFRRLISHDGERLIVS